MTHRDTPLLQGLALGARLIGVVVFASSAPGVLRCADVLRQLWEDQEELQSFVQFLFSSWSSEIVAGLASLALLAVSIMLWSKSLHVARWIRGDTEGSQWVSRCVLLLGCLFVLTQLGSVLPAAMRAAVALRQFGSSGLYVPPNPLLRLMFWLISTFGPFALGLVLIFKRRSVARYVLQGLGLSCDKCGYPTVGLTGVGVCPECGGPLRSQMQTQK